MISVVVLVSVMSFDNDQVDASSKSKKKSKKSSGVFHWLTSCGRGDSSPDANNVPFNLHSNDPSGQTNGNNLVLQRHYSKPLPPSPIKLNGQGLNHIESRTEMDYRYVYRMNNARRGNALVINNQEFHPRLELSSRSGSEVDASKITKQLDKLGFDTVEVQNRSIRDLADDIQELTEHTDHSNSDALAVVIMSHGVEGVIYAYDGPVELDSIFEPFRRCPSLIGKPKLFFIQACRGHKYDPGVASLSPDADDESFWYQYEWDQTDAIRSIQKLPTDADFLVAYSVVPGYFSWRNARYGSWFIEALSIVLNETDCSKVDILTILTRVSYRVARDKESRAADPGSISNGMKQVPCIVSMLTKSLYFM